MTYPDTERRQELVDCGLAHTVEQLDGAPGADGWCRPSELLADDAGLERLEEFLGADNISVVEPFGETWRTMPDFEGESLESLNERLHRAAGLRVVAVRDDRSVVQLVNDVRADIEERNVLGRVHPNRVLTGEPVYMGGPGENPEPDSDVGIESHTDLADPATPDIAVLDTGITSDHAWLADVVIPDPNDGDSLTRPDGALATEAGHGLFICGIVTRMSEGTLRIDPGRVLNQYGYGDDAKVSVELHETTAPVINLSWGCFADRFGPPVALSRVIRGLLADCERVIVAAAGNNKSDRMFYPAAFKGVIAVGALDTTTDPVTRAPFSNFGEAWVDVWAPGRHLRSAYVSGKYLLSDNQASHFTGAAKWSGTSFAAPVIAAEIARRYKERDLNLDPTPREVACEFLRGLPAEAVVGIGPDPVKVFIPEIDLTA
jgi:subtilisin family serine protease